MRLPDIHRPTTTIGGKSKEKTIKEVPKEDEIRQNQMLITRNLNMLKRNMVAKIGDSLKV